MDVPPSQTKETTHPASDSAIRSDSVNDSSSRRLVLSSSLRVYGADGPDRPPNRRRSRKTDGGDAQTASPEEALYLETERTRQKAVDAEPDVLQVYHESSLYGKVPLSTRVRTALRGGYLGFALYMVEFIGASMSGFLYIWASYTVDNPTWITTCQDIISVFFTVDYFVRIYCEPVRLFYMTSLGGIIDGLAVIPIITLFMNSGGAGAEDILHLLQFLRILRIYPLLAKIGIRGTNLGQQLFLLLISIIGIVLVDAGLLQYVELQYYKANKEDLPDCDATGCISFFRAIYFVWVTVSTVGYGDITPKSDWGRLVAMGTILVALVVLPAQIGNLSTIAARRPYGGTFNVLKVAGSRYVLVSGGISYATIESFLAEFYRGTHDTDLTAYNDSTYPLKTIILAPFRPSHQLSTLIAKYNGVVEFMEGSPLKEKDLDRVHARAASAIFLLADSGTQDAPAEDNSQVIRTLSVLRYCGIGTRVIVEVLKPETQFSKVWNREGASNLQVICLEKLRLQLLARRYCSFLSSPVSPSLSLSVSFSLIVALLISHETQLDLVHTPKVYKTKEKGDVKSHCRNHQRAHTFCFVCSCFIKGLYTLVNNLFVNEPNLRGFKQDHFISEYQAGYSNEVLPLVFPPHFHHHKFQDIADFLFKELNIVLFALDVSAGHGLRSQKLFPYGSEIKPNDIGLVVASELKIVSIVSMMGGKSSLCSTCFLSGACSCVHSLENSRRNQSVQQQVVALERAWNERQSFEERGECVPLTSSSSFRQSELIPYTMEGDRKEANGTSAVVNLANECEDVSEVEGSNGVEEANGGLVESLEADLKVKKELHRGISRKSMEVSDIIDRLLAWPPHNLQACPYPAALLKRKEEILENLSERTLDIVRLKQPHVLVCIQGTWQHNIYYFLSDLRRPNSPNPPVVILHPNELSSLQWGHVGMFPEVYFVQGSPLYEVDLLSAGVRKAEKIVVLANFGKPVDQFSDDTEESPTRERMMDAFDNDVHNIIIAANVESLIPAGAGEKLIIELQHPQNLQYLPPNFVISKWRVDKLDWKRHREALLHFTPPYMAGTAYSPFQLGFVTRATFYNRNAVSLLEQLIDGLQRHAEDDEEDGDLPYKSRRWSLNQIRVPSEFAARSYGALFHGLLAQHRALALGLYRASGTLGSPSAYVLTNPSKEVVVNGDDLVYILQ